jgi:enoyl-CoA hydratase/carnithine racemase
VEGAPPAGRVQLDIVDASIAVVTIDNERKANALSPQMSTELAAIFTDVEERSAVRAVVITGTGQKMFCAGNDITGTPPDDPAWNFAGLDELNRGTKPVLAALNGSALGGGLEIALACDIRFAVDTASFGSPETKLGLMAGIGGTVRLPHLVGLGRAMHLLLSAAPIDAATALDWGLVTKLTPPGAVLDAALEMASTITDLGPLAVRATKRSASTALGLPLADALAQEHEIAYSLRFTDESAEGRAAFREKRRPNFPDVTP